MATKQPQTVKWSIGIFLGMIGTLFAAVELAARGATTYVDKAIPTHPVLMRLQEDVAAMREDVGWIKGYLEERKP